jgi:AcrR family transcriptional regulator
VAATNTRERILDEALTSVGTKGYDGTSLDALASRLGVTKQAILYHFASKEQLLEAVIDRSAAEVAATLESALAAADGAGGGGWERIESIVRSVFRLAARRPELLGLLREVTRLGPPAATRLNDALDPLIGRAAGFLSAEMAAGTMRRQEPRLLLLSAYSSVIGAAPEVEVLRALGYEPTTRSHVRRRAEQLSFLRAALLAP